MSGVIKKGRKASSLRRKSRSMLVVVDGATIECGDGCSGSALAVPPGSSPQTINGKPVATILHHEPGVHIHGFQQCSIIGDCEPLTTDPWISPLSLTHGDAEVVLTKIAVLFCNISGMVRVIDEGQSSVVAGSSSGASWTAVLDQLGHEWRFWEKDAVARGIVCSLSLDELRLLPAHVYNMLLNHLLSGFVSEEDKAAYFRLYEARAPFDPSFALIDTANRAELVRRLGESEVVRDAASGWSSMGEQERKELLMEVVEVQRDVYGIEFEIFLKLDDYGNATGHKNGKYSHGDREVSLNTSSNQYDDFSSVVGTLTHEVAHAYQGMLVDMLEAGDIAAGDPLYNQAVMFQQNKRDYATTAEAGYDVYQNQPQEHHSRETGLAAKHAVE